MYSNSSASDDAASTTTPARRSRWLPLALGAAFGLLAVGAVLMLTNRRHVGRLTPEAYEAAVERWKKNGPANYEQDLELTGNRPGTIHVEVRHGEVTAMTRDGVEPRQRRTWDYWSVPGQFDTIGEELEMARDPVKSFNAPGASQVVLWAEFDSEFGYPKEFQRIVLGADFEVHWIVTRFQLLPVEK